VAVPTQTVHIPLGINIFSPAHIVVPVGSAVTWWNDSVSAGNLQNEDHDVAIVNSVGSTLPDMEDLDGGGVYTHVFDSPGTWSYICHRHSGAAVHTNEVFESNYAHRAPGPYRCMSGTVTVR
jgi:plastocyanin